LDGAFGVEGRRPLEEGQAITVAAGFEFRHGVEDEEALTAVSPNPRATDER
jgi:hypothetical protein